MIDATALPSYPAYRPSGVDWLGDIPAHWEAKRLKFLAPFRYGDSLAEDARELGDVLVFGSNGPVGMHSRPNTTGPCLIIGRKGSFGKVNWSANPCFAIDTTFFVNSSQAKADLRWLYYALPLLELDSLSQDSAVPGLSRAFAHEQWLPGVPLPEQRAIADYLDRATARIDALVAAKERLLELLAEKRRALISHAFTKGLDPSAPMKDSGIPWLGEIPAHWKALPLKRWVSVKITDGPHETPELLSEGVPFVSAEAMQGGRLNFEAKRGYIAPEVHARYIQKLYPRRDDIFICKSGATTGKVAIVETDEEFSVWSPLALIRADCAKARSDFLYLALQADYVQDQIRSTWSAGTQPNIAMSEIEQLVLVAPPCSEQTTIVGMVDYETARLDALAGRVRAAIERLREYRAALISAAVTGKVDVRGEIRETEAP